MPTKPTTFYEGSTGARLTRVEFLSRLAGFSGDVILFGENHCDPAGHQLEMEVLKALHQERGASDRDSSGRDSNDPGSNGPALSLEFFDREAQTALDEYVGGFLNLEGFMRDARPPGNVRDYLPLIDFCKANGLSVTAANCPRRYTRMVSQSCCTLKLLFFRSFKIRGCRANGSDCDAI